MRRGCAGWAEKSILVSRGYHLPLGAQRPHRSVLGPYGTHSWPSADQLSGLRLRRPLRPAAKQTQSAALCIVSASSNQPSWIEYNRLISLIPGGPRFGEQSTTRTARRVPPPTPRSRRRPHLALRPGRTRSRCRRAGTGEPAAGTSPSRRPRQWTAARGSGC